MYLATVVLLLLVLPLASVAIEAVTHGGADVWFLVGKWFVFWAAGVRLGLAGLRQTFNPAFTAQTIFGLKDETAFAIVKEVGFGNLSMGALGIASLFNRDWIPPAALCGGLYYGLAGIGHLVKGERNSHENIALISDLLIFALLACVFVSGIVQK
jgi:hypothetical protein